MADFNNNVQDVNPRVDTVAPVQDNTTAQAVGATTGLLGGLGAAVVNSQVYGQQLAAAKEKSRVLGGFEENLLRVADLHDQGVMSQDAARRNVRRLTASALANHPTLQGDVNDLVGKVLSTKGLGENVASGTQQEQDQRVLNMKFLQDAQNDGFGRPSDPPEVQAQMANAHQAYKLQLQQLQLSGAQMEQKIKANNVVSSGLSITSAQQSISTGAINQQRARLGLVQDQAEATFRSAGANLVSNYVPKFNQDLDDIDKNTALTPQQKVIASQNLLATVKQTVTGLALQGNSINDAAALTDTFTKRAEIQQQVWTGALDKTVADTKLHNVQTIEQQRLIDSSPQVLRLTAISNLVPPAAQFLQIPIGKSLTELFTKNGQLPDVNGNVSTQPGNPTHHTDDEKKDVDQYGKMLNGVLATINSGAEKDPAVMQEVHNNVQGVLKGLTVYGPTANDATALNGVVGLIANPAFGKFAQSNQGTLDADSQEKAQQVFRNYYQSQVIPLVQDQFLNNKVSIGNKPGDPNTIAGMQGRDVPDERETDAVIHTEFIGSSMRFVPNNMANSAVVDKAKDLNNRVAPVINTMIRADAHLHGSTDYKQYYDANMSFIAPEVTPNSGSGELTPQRAIPANPLENTVPSDSDVSNRLINGQ